MLVRDTRVRSVTVSVRAARIVPKVPGVFRQGLCASTCSSLMRELIFGYVLSKCSEEQDRNGQHFLRVRTVVLLSGRLSYLLLLAILFWWAGIRENIKSDDHCGVTSQFCEDQSPMAVFLPGIRILVSSGQF